MSLCSTNMPHRTCRVIHSSPCHITDIEACLEWSLVAYGEETRRPKSRRTVSKATAGGRRQASGLLLTRPPSLVSSKPSESLLWRCVACRNGKQQSCRYPLFLLSLYSSKSPQRSRQRSVGWGVPDAAVSAASHFTPIQLDSSMQMRSTAYPQFTFALSCSRKRLTALQCSTA
jgi:hypothetical protein